MCETLFLVNLGFWMREADQKVLFSDNWLKFLRKL